MHEFSELFVTIIDAVKNFDPSLKALLFLALLLVAMALTLSIILAVKRGKG